MVHFLDANQIAEEAALQGLDDIVIELEEVTQRAAIAIANKRSDVAIISEASNEPGFGGLCVGFGPINEGDKCPEDFLEYDRGSDWANE